MGWTQRDFLGILFCQFDFSFYFCAIKYCFTKILTKMKKTVLSAMMMAMMCFTISVNAQSDNVKKEKKECCQKQEKKECCQKQEKKDCCEKKSEKKACCKQEAKAKAKDCKKCTECKSECGDKGCKECPNNHNCKKNCKK